MQSPKITYLYVNGKPFYIKQFSHRPNDQESNDYLKTDIFRVNFVFVIYFHLLKRKNYAILIETLIDIRFIYY